MATSTFTWQDVTYGVGVGAKSKEILRGISGSLGGGEVCAIVGPSGSGKTSLLNILAGRIRHKGKAQRVGGTILHDGKPVGGAALRKRIAYVMQQDLLNPTSTPREALMFSATLRLPTSVSLAEKRGLVEKMLSDLGLLDCADTYIGNDMIRGISGGEMKRVSIGIELVMRPFLIFLDEPTSGLDSYAAFMVIKKLSELAASGGCNVLVTIHQPSSEVFHTFQKALVLFKGDSLFMGPLDALSRQLAAAGHGCPAEYNLCDHTVYIIQTESEDTLQKLKKAMEQGALADGTAHAAALKVKVDPADAAAPVSSTAKVSIQPREEKAAGFWRQLIELSRRENQGIWRDKAGLVASILIPSIMNLFFAGIFSSVGDTSSDTYDVQSHFGSITQVLIGGMFGAAQPLLLRFPLDRGIFLREYATHTYGSLPYFLSKTMVELPRALLDSAIVWLIVYWLMGLQGSWFVFVGVYWITGLAASSTALLVGCIASNAEVAQRASPLLFVPQLLFAGFFIKTTLMPDYLAWIQYVCGLKYGMNLVVLNEFGENTRASWTTQQQTAAEYIITANDINPELWWAYLLILLLIITFFRVLAILALARRATTFF